MAKKRNYRAKRKTTIPVAPAAAIFATLNGPVQRAMAGDFKGAMEGLYQNYVGDQKLPTYTALALGFGAHWAANKIGANRVIANTGIPIFRI